MNCNTPLHATVLRQSVSFMGYALCDGCQQTLKSKLKSTSRETIKLYFSLKQRGVAAELAKPAGYDTMDIAILKTKMSIEVDEPQQNGNPKQALAALKQSLYSWKKGYLTLHIPNMLVAYNLEETTEYILEMLSINNRRLSYHH